jgi:hypothetical protein
MRDSTNQNIRNQRAESGFLGEADKQGRNILIHDKMTRSQVHSYTTAGLQKAGRGTHEESERK